MLFLNGKHFGLWVGERFVDKILFSMLSKLLVLPPVLLSHGCF